jgi:hypothetical protein
MKERNILFRLSSFTGKLENKEIKKNEDESFLLGNNSWQQQQKTLNHQRCKYLFRTVVMGTNRTHEKEIDL